MKGRIYKKVVLLLFAFLAFPAGYAREYAVVNYQKSSGLPGNKVYHVYQDKAGLIWIGTDNGLVSFNGYTFRTYTTRDGLPSNEVFGVKEDQKGRLWIMSFSNQPCYLRGGKIYNVTNDTLLAKVRVNSIIRHIEFDAWGNIWFGDSKGALIRINAQEEIMPVDKVLGQQLSAPVSLLTKDSGMLTVVTGSKIYQYNKDHFEMLAQPMLQEADTSSDFGVQLFTVKFALFRALPLPQFLKLQQDHNRLYFSREEQKRVTSFHFLSPDRILACLDGSTYLIDSHTGKRLDQFLKGYTVSGGLLARDGSLWLGTIGKGLYHYTPAFIHSIPFTSNASPVQFIRAGKEVYFIKAPNILVKLKRQNTGAYRVAAEYNNNMPYDYGYCCYISRGAGGSWISYGGRIRRLRAWGSPLAGKSFNNYCKSVAEEDERYVLIGTANGIFRMDKNRFAMTDTFYEQRSTCITKIRDTIYAGTLTGLLAFTSRKRKIDTYLKYPELRLPIAAIAASGDSLLWVANNNASLLGIRNGRAVARIDVRDGLTCKSISAIRASSRFLWVGTDNGLYAFDPAPPFKIVRRLSLTDGLCSDQITYIEAAEGQVWVGTDNGISYFSERDITRPGADARFMITGIQNEGDVLPQTGAPIALKSGALQIGYDVIDQSGLGVPQVSYRINKDKWVAISGGSLYFPAIPYGGFTVQIQASSPHWAMPKVITLSFYRPYPYYFSSWFLGLAGLFFFILTGGLLAWFIRRLRRKDQEKLNKQLHLLELEQMALQGQMNPHFVFNSIASIREHYNSGELARGNRLLDTFTALTRTTFEMSSRAFTTLAEELIYLKQYLLVEQERFSYSFGYVIDQDIGLPAATVPVPAMLLQPLVENAIRHGVRHLPDGAGKIRIHMTRQLDMIHISIADNGRGRAYAMELKRKSRLQHRVTSTTVNQERMRILSKLFDRKIQVHTEDIRNEEGKIAGTIVFISYPINIYTIEH